MLVMPKGRNKNPESKRSQGVDRHTKPKVSFHPPLLLLEAFDQHIDSIRPETDRTKVLVMLIEEWLQRQGVSLPKR